MCMHCIPEATVPCAPEALKKPQSGQSSVLRPLRRHRGRSESGATVPHLALLQVSCSFSLATSFNFLGLALGQVLVFRWDSGLTALGIRSMGFERLDGHSVLCTERDVPSLPHDIPCIAWCWCAHVRGRSNRACKR